MRRNSSKLFMKSIGKLFTTLWMKIPRPFADLSKLVESYDSLSDRAPEILYFGDSVLERISWDDTDKRTVDQMLAEYFVDEKRVICIARPAYHLEIYYHLLKIFEVMHYKPELVILPVNMRSFSPQWAANPAWKFDEEIESLQKYMRTGKIPPLRNKAQISTLSDEERLTLINLPFTDFTYIGQFIDIINSKPVTAEQAAYRKKQIFVFHYLNLLQENNPRLLYLGKALDLLSAIKIKVLVYITPINYQGGIKYVGDGFIDVIRTNTSVVQNFLSPYLDYSEVVRFLDLQEYFESDCFFNADEASEHLNQTGRAKLAQTIAGEIRNRKLVTL